MLSSNCYSDDLSSTNYNAKSGYFSGGGGENSSGDNYKTKLDIVVFYESRITSSSASYNSCSVAGPLNYSYFNNTPEIYSITSDQDKFYDDTDLTFDVYRSR